MNIGWVGKIWFWWRGGWGMGWLDLSGNVPIDIPALSKGTNLYLILVQYRGPKMVNCELVGEKAY